MVTLMTSRAPSSAIRDPMRRPEEPSAIELQPDGYSIRLASRLSGLSPETLRIWEYRYGFPLPKRGPSNRRLYSSNDIDALCLIARAIASGYRPSEVVGKPASEIKAMVDTLQSATHPAPDALRKEHHTTQELVELLQTDDIEPLQQHLQSLASSRGPKAFIIEVVQPLLAFMGIQWQLGKLEIRHEHLMSALLTTQLKIMQRRHEIAGNQASVVVLATLPGEKHTLGLEMVALYLTSCGVRSVFLGPELPPDQIVAASRSFRARAVGLTVTTSSDPARTQEDVRHLLRHLPASIQLWLGGEGALEVRPAAHPRHPHPKVEWIANWARLEQVIQTLG
jgi:DNA-binding transcriptional MerR regulator